MYVWLYLFFDCPRTCVCGCDCDVVCIGIDLNRCTVSVFWLRWCGWCRWRVGRGLGQGSGAVGWCYVCVRCESGFSV